MGIYEHANLFQGKPVIDYGQELGITDPINTVYRLRTDYDDENDFIELLTKFLEDPNVSKINSLVIGAWDYDQSSSQALVDMLIGASQKLSGLSALFLGDIISEENEISWIEQCNLSALLQAYPQLEYLKVRGNVGLSFGELKLDRLKTLIVETGGLSPSVVKEVCQAQLPILEHLELWLGDSNYGGDTTPEDLAPIFAGSLFPQLSYLGLRDSEIADQVAVAVANAPILQQLKVLDLSLGNIGDIGAAALLASPIINHLEKLDLHHHYISDELTQKLAKLSFAVDISDLQEPYVYDDGEVHRYISVSE
jgi:hypothetical protein